MSLRRRLLKWSLIGLAGLLFALWFGFTTFFFNPLESDFESDVSSLIPRDVDFYLAKASLADDLDGDLRLSMADDFEASARGQAIAKLPLYRDLVGSLDVAAITDEVRATLATLPVTVDPLAVFGGSDVALAGYFRGAGMETSDWAVYGRANWLGKLAVALLGYPSLVDLESQGMTAEEVLDGESGQVAWKLSGGQLTRPLYIWRVLDVVCVGTDVEMFEAIPALEAKRGEDSLGMSAKYHDHVNVEGRDGDELEVYVDYRALSEMNMWTGRWPDPNSESFLAAFTSHLFQSGTVREALGTVRFGPVVGVDLHGVLSTELMTPMQKKLYRERGLDKNALSRDVARLVPADAGVLLYLQGDLGDFLREGLGVAEDALVSNLEDLVREVWGYNDTLPLIDDLENALGDRFALVMRENDYPDDGDKGPPHDDRVVPAWALVTWVDDEDEVRDLRTMVQNRQSAFGIRGREPGSGGVYENTVTGGFKVLEYWNPLIPGTGHLASILCTLGSQQLFIVSNNHKMLGHMTSTYHDGDGLSAHSTFATQLGDGLPSADALLWLNPKAMGNTWRGMAKLWASDKVAIDWSVERPRIEKLALKEHMPGSTWGNLSEGEQAKLDMLVQPELDSFEREFRTQHSTRFYAEYLDRIAAFEALDALLVQLSIDQRDLDLAIRAKIPFAE